MNKCRSRQRTKINIELNSRAKSTSFVPVIMPVSAHKRIILLGQTGTEKNSLTEILTKDNVHEVNHSADSGTCKCQNKKSTTVTERSITVIDAPGFFDTKLPEKKLKEEILLCMIESSPGPHAFLILLQVDKFTEEEKAVIKKIDKYFSEESYKYATVVLTRGDRFPEGMKIEQFLYQRYDLRDLVKKCGGRCHVFDSEKWKKSQDDYKFQVADLFKTIDKTIEENKGAYLTNEMFQKVEKQIAEEENHIRKSSANLTAEEIRKQAKKQTLHTLMNVYASTPTRELMVALFTLPIVVLAFVTGAAAFAFVTGAAAFALATGAAVVLGGPAVVGIAVVGWFIGKMM
ncbi:GTPase IMAP family member 7-like [Thalassophryne amazonica]|uniref:GTPase IMAP family member 7-like n=1 Tax=Thalassophryne amazonica TaxID=390379 RepID=UPI0014709214|nr:GTPase IMAP family member 7-like [Thalassophryne amazonica]